MQNTTFSSIKLLDCLNLIDKQLNSKTELNLVMGFQRGGIHLIIDGNFWNNDNEDIQLKFAIPRLVIVPIKSSMD